MACLARLTSEPSVLTVLWRAGVNRGREVGIVARRAASFCWWCDGSVGALALGVPWAARHRADGGLRLALPLPALRLVWGWVCDLSLEGSERCLAATADPGRRA